MNNSLLLFVCLLGALTGCSPFSFYNVLLQLSLPAVMFSPIPVLGVFLLSFVFTLFNFSLSFLSYRNIFPFLPVPAPQANRIAGKFLIWADCLPSSRTLIKLQNAPHIPLILFPAFTIKDDESFIVRLLLIPFLLICV